MAWLFRDISITSTKQHALYMCMLWVRVVLDQEINFKKKKLDQSMTLYCFQPFIWPLSPEDTRR